MLTSKRRGRTAPRGQRGRRQYLVTWGSRPLTGMLPATFGLRAADPRSFSERIAGYVDAGACWNAALSPNGKIVAFLADETGCPQVYVSPLALWAPRQITFGPHEVVDLAWSRDGGMIGYAADPGGGGRTQLHVVDRDGRSPRPMFVAHGHSAFAGAWTRDGRGYAFSTTLGRDSTGGVTGCTAYLLDLAEST